MNDFGGIENSRSAFLGSERQRESEGAPYGGFFGEVFEVFGAFFAKSSLFFAKIERNGEVFEDFEKGGVVIALIYKINHELHE